MKIFNECTAKTDIKEEGFLDFPLGNVRGK